MTIRQREKVLGRRRVESAVVETDFSLYDRTIGLCTRAMEREFAALLLAEDEQQLFNSCQNLIQHSIMNHLSGYQVSDISQRWSGEPATSIMNGMWNLFTSFLAWCNAGRDPMVFFTVETLSSIFVEGDDGLTFLDFTAEQACAAGAQCGLEVKAARVPCIEHATFLGRVHAYGEGANLVSMADLPRTLRKWHLSAAPSQATTASQLLAAKALSYMATDYRSPVIGAMAWAFLQLNSDQKLHAGHHKLFSDRLSLADISEQDMRAAPAPEFNAVLAATYAYFYDISIHEQRSWHNAWLVAGRGGPWPDPLCLPPVDGAEYIEPI